MGLVWTGTYPVSTARDALEDLVGSLGVQKAGRVVHDLLAVGIVIVVARTVVDGWSGECQGREVREDADE
jgi:hypothetical protein